MSQTVSVDKTRRSIGFGIEKIGHIAVANPIIFWALIAVITIASLSILPRAKFDSNLVNMYEGSGAQYTTFADVRTKFGMFESDLFIIVDAPDLADPAAFNAARLLSEDLSLTNHVAAVLSPFSLRLPSEDGGTVPAFPLELQTREQISEAFARLNSELPLAENLGKADRSQISMIVMPQIVDSESASKALAAIQKTVSEYADEPINVSIGGQPVWMDKLLELAGQDQIMLNVAGLVIASLLALVIFRNPLLAGVVTVAPFLIAMWAMAATLAMFGSISFFTMVLATLMMMLSFAESVYFVLMWQREKRRGLIGADAVRATMLEVAPATVLSMMTTAVAFISLSFAPGRGIKEFAIGGTVGTFLALVALLTILPLLLLAVDRYLPTSLFKPEVEEASWQRKHANLVRRFAGPVAFFAVVLSVLLMAPYAHIKSSFSVLDLVPKSLLTAEGGEDGDSTGIGGIAPVYMVLDLDDDGSSVSTADLNKIQTVSAMMQEEMGAGQVLSLAEFGNFGSPEETDALLEAIGVDLSNRFITRDGSQSMLTAFADPNASGEELKERLAKLSARVADAGIVSTLPTGFRVLTTYESENLIDQMEFSLFTAVILSILLIGFAFREWRIMILSAIPNMFPLLAVVCYLYFSGTGQTMTSVMVLTIAFGVAVNDTIHFLNAYRHNRLKMDRLPAISASTRQVGKSMLTTTAILCAGVVATLFSAMPQVNTFGEIFMGAMLAALVGDLIFLPAIIAATRKRSK